LSGYVYPAARREISSMMIALWVSGFPRYGIRLWVGVFARNGIPLRPLRIMEEAISRAMASDDAERMLGR
jgi:hypothetical protein